MMAGGSMVKLSGQQEVPPVTTAASGTGTITVAADGAIGGSVTVSGLAGPRPTSIRQPARVPMAR